MKQVKSSMRRAYFPFAVIGLFSVVFYIMTYYTIPIEEDMEYGLTGFLRRHGLSNSYNFAGMWNHIMHLYRDCNGRLIDKLPVPILVLCPKWLFAIFNVGVVWLIVGASYKLMALAIGGTWNRKPLCTSFMGFISKYPWHASAFVFLMMMFFPWHTKMLTVSYSLGYIWTSAIALWLVYYFCNSRLIGGSKILLAFVLIGCVLSGILHELLPCVLCSAFLIPALCSGNRMLIWRRLGIIASLFIGYLVLSHTVGHIYRVSYYDIHFDWRRICSTYRGLMPSSSVMQSIVFFLTLAVFFICRVKILSFAEILKSLKRSFYPLREHTPLWTVIITLVGGCITSIVIFGFFDNAARIMSYAILFSFIGGLILLVRWPGGLPRWFCRVLQGCIIAVALCGLAVWTVSCFVQNKIFKAFNIAEKLIYDSGEDTIYLDIPILMWSEMQYSTSFPWQTLTPFYNRHSSLNFNPLRDPYEIVIVPEVFKDMENTAALSEIIEMDSMPAPYSWINRDEGIFKYGDYYMYTNPNDVEFEAPIEDVTRFLRRGGSIKTEAKFDNGVERPVWFSVMVFTTPKSRKRAYWLDLALDSEIFFKHDILSLDTISVKPSWIDFVDSGTYGRVQLFPNEPSEYQNKVIRP